MDNLKDIFNNIRERFTNPLIFSFIIFWLTVNWQITIALFWYDTAQIEKEGYSTIFEFIKSNINFKNAFLIPFVLSMGYTFLIPITKNIIRAFYSWTSKWGEAWNLKITRGGKIPFEKYFLLRREYDTRSKLLEEVITKETEAAKKYESINTEVLKNKSEINELQVKLTESNNIIFQFYNQRFLNGYWTNTFEDTIRTELKGTEEIFIEDGRYYLIRPFGDKVHAFNITNFHFDIRSKLIFFIKEQLNQEPSLSKDLLLRFNINNLQMENEDRLIGRENGTTKIQYTRTSKAKFVVPSNKKAELDSLMKTIKTLEGVVELDSHQSDSDSLNLYVTFSNSVDRHALIKRIADLLKK